MSETIRKRPKSVLAVVIDILDAKNKRKSTNNLGLENHV